MATSCNVRVIARFRPFNQRELGLGCSNVHQIQGSQRVDITSDGHPKRSFAFDQVFGEDSRQRDVYSILQVSGPPAVPRPLFPCARVPARTPIAKIVVVGRADDSVLAKPPDACPTRAPSLATRRRIPHWTS
jgi:hypothetical protein|eukprot:COSAG06_NODE_2119_length_7551_cov_319.577966_2_plen_132_part_00